MKQSDTPRWRVCRDFQSASWPDGMVVYDKLSGDTHQLGPAAAYLLQQIQAAPCTLQALETSVLSSDLLAPDVASPNAIEAILHDLSELGFISPEPH